jgi:hypothetical protein
MQAFPHWQSVLVWSSVISIGVVLACLIAIPWVVGRLPTDYFARSRRQILDAAAGATVFTRMLDAIKNVIGFIFVVLGAIMLVTPGQGVLTILVGLLLMNFPGKYRLERWLVMRPGVMRGLNWLRSLRGLQPFVPFADEDAAAGGTDLPDR